MYRVNLTCTGIPTAEGPKAAKDVATDFVQHRTWHSNVACEWDGERLLFHAENSYDADGRGLRNELWDCICARVAAPFNCRVRVDRVESLKPPKHSG